MPLGRALGFSWGERAEQDITRCKPPHLVSLEDATHGPVEHRATCQASTLDSPKPSVHRIFHDGVQCSRSINDGAPYLMAGYGP